jgi:hypothetical protein
MTPQKREMVIFFFFLLGSQSSGRGPPGSSGDRRGPSSTWPALFWAQGWGWARGRSRVCPICDVNGFLSHPVRYGQLDPVCHQQQVTCHSGPCLLLGSCVWGAVGWDPHVSSVAPIFLRLQVLGKVM